MIRESIRSLEFRQLDFSYGEAAEIFKGLSHHFRDDMVTVLQGPTGGGKTTLIRLLLGMLQPGAGEYLINGQVVNRQSFHEFNRFRLNMGYAADDGGLIHNMTIYENFKLPLDYHGYRPAADRREYILERLARFNLDKQMFLRPSFVSGGTRKVASVLKAFLLDPEVLILNNPTMGLGSEHVLPLVNLIRHHRESRNLRHVLICSEDRGFLRHLDARVLQVSSTHLTESTLAEAA